MTRRAAEPIPPGDERVIRDFEERKRQREREGEAEAPRFEEPLPPEFSEDRLALGFTEKHSEDLRYVAGWGRWLQWDTGAFRFDDTLRVFDLARRICREASESCTNKRVASRIASAQTVAAAVRLAQSDPIHARTVDCWDSDPWLLNTPGGTVDLRTGDLRPHRRDDHITKRASVSPGGACPQWEKFLKRVTDGDHELQAFLQRMTGYALTGSTRDHALFFLYGTGANGKGTFLNALTTILGNEDYAKVAPMETFTVSGGDRHPTDLAGLRGARFVTAQETEEGRRWAENKLKSLTGGDPISARFMRQDFFTFTPQFKLVIAGNHKPRLRSVDEAIRRRFHLVPFTVTIPAEERDHELAEKLIPEYGGILAWAIRGCLAWQSLGLFPPQCVREATESYFEAEDAIGRWIEEKCVISRNLTATTNDLFASFKAWAEANGEEISSQKGLVEVLEGRGCRSARNVGPRRVRGLAGIGLTAEEARKGWSDRSA